MKLMPKKGFFLLFLGFFAVMPQFIFAQADNSGEFQRRMQSGTRFYREARMQEAAAEFRRAQEMSVNREDWSHALYWVILSQLALADYGSSIRDMDELERRAPNSVYAREMVYHRARIYYNQGYFEDALILFQQYIDSIPGDDPDADERKAAAFFWMGECLYGMGQYEESQKFYAWVIARYPESPKIEASSYRIDTIKQKRIEAELLELLRWSHEESLRTSEEYQRRLRTYEHTLNTYQRQIAELTQGQTDDFYEDFAFDPMATGDDLIEKARQLGFNIQRLIDDHEMRDTESGGAR